MDMRRHLPLTLAALAATAALIPAAAQADGVKRTASGAGPADITVAVNAFRADIGGDNNAGGPAAASGRREINWDGVPDSNADPNPFPAGTFLGRGILFDTPGTGFKVSANAGNPTATPVRFGNPEFQVFSAQKLFAPTGSNLYDSHFFAPGTVAPATTNAFGVVFTDVDVTGSAKIEYFDPTGAALDTVVVPVSPNGGLSFAGESFNAGERIGRVRVTSGTTATLTADGAGQDAVAQDDFIFGEPLAGLVAFQAPEARVDEDAGTAALTVTRQGDRSGTATVSYATADGSAKAGQDYAAKTGTVTFAAGRGDQADHDRRQRRHGQREGRDVQRRAERRRGRRAGHAPHRDGHHPGPHAGQEGQAEGQGLPPALPGAALRDRLRRRRLIPLQAHRQRHPGQEARPEEADSVELAQTLAARGRQHVEHRPRQQAQGQAAQGQDQADADPRPRRRHERAPARGPLTRR